MATDQTKTNSKSKQQVVVLTGAGISAESGLATFRDPNGIWAQYNIDEVATPGAWARNPAKVLDFYNARRRQLFEVQPNAAHYALAALQELFEEVHIITQNVDDLHERAGSKRILHLHGELRKARSSQYPELVYPWDKDIRLGDLCERGAQLRPHIVWFEEEVPLFPHAVELTQQADIFIVVGTSLLVYPAAFLTEYAFGVVPSYYVDPHPRVLPGHENTPHLHIIPKSATEGVPIAIEHLQQHYLKQ